MKRREVAGNSSTRTFIREVYKAIGFWSGKLKTRFLEIGIRNGSWRLVVFEKGIITEVTV